MTFNLIEWLLTPTMLMTKLKEHTGEAHLSLSNESWRLLTANEEAYLNCNTPTTPFFIRQCRILSKGQVAWSAVTYIPKETYFAYESLFKCLNEKPLGQLIYANPIVKRESLKTFTNTYPFFLNDLNHFNLSDTIGVRDSLFMFEEKHPLYLFEMFEQGLQRAIEA